MKILFNPFTGLRRNPKDIESDPNGYLLLAPHAMVLASRSEIMSSQTQSLAAKISEACILDAFEGVSDLEAGVFGPALVRVLVDVSLDAKRWNAWGVAMVSCVKNTTMDGNPFLETMEKMMSGIKAENFTMEKLNAAVDSAIKETS